MTSDNSIPGASAPVRPIWKAAALSGVLAAVATTVIAAVGDLAGVSLDVDGEPIPIIGFTVVTVVAVFVGFFLATALDRWAPRPRRTFVIVTVLMVIASVVPDLTVDMATGTTLLLMAAHLVAAAIVIPSIASSLRVTR